MTALADKVLFLPAHMRRLSGVIAILIVAWMGPVVAEEIDCKSLAADPDGTSESQSDDQKAQRAIIFANYQDGNDLVKRKIHQDDWSQFRKKRPVSKAIQHLICAYRKTIQTDVEHEIFANELGNAYANNHQLREALDCYEIAKKSSQQEVSIAATLNRARLLPAKRFDGAMLNIIKEFRAPDRVRFLLNAIASLQQGNRGEYLAANAEGSECKPSKVKAETALAGKSLRDAVATAPVKMRIRRFEISSRSCIRSRK